MRRDWKVRQYKNSILIDEYVIKGRTQGEAVIRAEMTQTTMGDKTDEYIMTPIVRRAPSPLATFVKTL